MSRDQPQSAEEVAAGLREAGYLPGESTALVSYLAARLGKPILVEGPAGVGKTELAKALARYLGRSLVRLQCYEGLDEAKALYEWNYRKQLLRIQAESSDDAGWDTVQDDIFGAEFLLARPLMQAIASEEPVVLLIDEIDKTDQEFEAMLLELLSDFQITIPELGRIEARTHPVVLLTSNNSRELHRGAQAALPVPVARLPLDRARARDRPPARARAARDGRAAARRGRRDGARAGPQEAAVDRGVDRLGARAAADGRRRHHGRRLPVDAVDHRQAPHRPRRGGRARRRQAGGMTFPAHVLRFAEELRAEGVAVGTSELNDAFAALGEVGWTEPAPFREALAATIAKSPEDRRVFDLVFERFFFRAAEGEALRQGVRERAGAEGEEEPEGMAGGERIDFDDLREQVLRAIREENDAAMRDLARLAIAAFGRRGQGSGVLGVDVQRIRRSLGLRSEPGGPVREDPPTPRPEPLTRDQIRRFELHLRRELERAQIERTQALPPSRPLNELDRALPSGPLQDLAAVHRVVMQLKRRLATQGHETRGRKRHAHVDVRRTMRASLQTGGVPVELRYRPRRPRRPELYVLCDVSTSVTSASVFFLSVLHALHDSFRKMRSFVFVERISEVTDVFERERSFKAVSDAISKDAGVADVSGYTDYGRVWREFLVQVEDDLHPRATVIVLGDARTNGRDPAAHLFAAVAERAGPHVLAQPRAAAVLELRRLGDRRLRAVLRGLRVLDDAPARGLREGAHASGSRLTRKVFTGSAMPFRRFGPAEEIA